MSASIVFYDRFSSLILRAIGPYGDGVLDRDIKEAARAEQRSHEEFSIVPNTDPVFVLSRRSVAPSVTQLPTTCAVCGSRGPLSPCTVCRAPVCNSSEWPATAGSPREPSCVDAHDQQCAQNATVGCVECNYLGWCLMNADRGVPHHIERCDTCGTLTDDAAALAAAVANGYVHVASGNVDCPCCASVTHVADVLHPELCADCVRAGCTYMTDEEDSECAAWLWNEEEERWELRR